ncbi:hypothetical protein GOP47_0004253 [Adiantum capillus-veneris]|uniref:Major facilitator superfamily (MFS) profile domain-containing protein n=1 Tax=Adiantum capillus-veneris TaxID=13818 RepID=A0A9D4ZQ73_ADICA|nr:hypothetical protein GOP47_0004253 [Adiantum capillus-veneris]
MAVGSVVEANKAVPLPPPPPAQITAYVVYTCIMAGSGGLMYGYDLVIAGGISIMDDFLLKFYPNVYIHKKNAQEDNYCRYNNQVFQLFSSSLYLAALIATFFASVVSKKLGRRATMLGAGMFFIVGTVIGTAAENLAMIITGRALLGCGIGFANQAVPVYLSEIAPPRIRGGLNILFGVYLTIGILSGNIVNYFAAKVHPWGWRLSLGIAGIPALLLTLCSLVIVETPSSLIERGKHEQARDVLRRIRGTTEVLAELDELIETSRRDSRRPSWESFREFFCERRHRGEMVVACMLPFFQQVAGNDAILFYGTFLFKLAGFGDQASLYSAIITGACAFLSCSSTILFIDRLGRRPLLLIGCALMASSLVVVGSIFAATLQGDVRKLPLAESVTEVVMVCIFVIGFGVSLGPLAWLIPSEILSQEVRSAGQSIAVFVNMLFKFIIAQTFLSMLCAFKFGIFFFFAGWSFVIATFIILLLPETKQVPLHKMETLWQDHWFWKQIVGPPSSPNPVYYSDPSPML